MSSDYYEIFGVAPDADVETIKQRYRVLVRENHPDVSDNEDAHARMQMILEAWSVLSQPDSRARYDLSRREPTQRSHSNTTGRADADRSTPGAKRPHSNGTAAKNRSTSSRPKVDVNPRTSNPRTKLLTMVFEAAQLYHQEGNSADAITLCNRVLKSDPKNSEAAALLGDIYAQQDRQDLALLMYKRAMQNESNNLLYRQKWEALQQKTSVPDEGHAASTPSAAATQTPPVATPPAAPPVAPRSTQVPRGTGCGAGVLLVCCTLLAAGSWLLTVIT